MMGTAAAEQISEPVAAAVYSHDFMSIVAYGISHFLIQSVDEIPVLTVKFRLNREFKTVSVCIRVTVQNPLYQQLFMLRPATDLCYSPRNQRELYFAWLA